MTKEQLFKKYSIDESHSDWIALDNWCSVEIYRILKGKLPTDDPSISWVCEFLDKAHDGSGWWQQNVMTQPRWGSLYLTAKRLVYRHHQAILEELNSNL